MTNEQLFIKAAEWGTLLFTETEMEDEETGRIIEYDEIGFEAYCKAVEYMLPEELDDLSNCLEVAYPEMWAQLCEYLDTLEEEAEKYYRQSNATSLPGAHTVTTTLNINGFRYTVTVTVNVEGIDMNGFEFDADPFTDTDEALEEWERLENMLDDIDREETQKKKRHRTKDEYLLSEEGIGKATIKDLNRLLAVNEANENYKTCALIRDEIKRRGK